MANNKPKQIHTVHRNDGWCNISVGASRVAKIYPTKAAAQAAGRVTAINQKAEHFIHNINGKIGSKNSYGKDPHPPRG